MTGLQAPIVHEGLLFPDPVAPKVNAQKIHQFVLSHHILDHQSKTENVLHLTEPKARLALKLFKDRFDAFEPRRARKDVRIVSCQHLVKPRTKLLVFLTPLLEEVEIGRRDLIQRPASPQALA
ncbi:MAG: hypothetical protein RMK02_06190 [Burkholderiales bacterium]|nr:hypothetical protein [Burkholderiales bacterium]